ncbi:MAG: thiamine diphosphokinase [Treponema sp.]|nr:thiamine diphosphokinase [Treponema sp.]
MRCVIIGAAPINNYKKIRSFLQPDDFVIVCDGGLNHIKKLRVKPNLIVGDFDSHKNPNLPIETITLPREKDDTDSVFALKTAISRGFKDFLFIGMIGARLDHGLGNLYMLIKCHEEGLKALLLDDYSEMQIVGKQEAYITDAYPYFSLLNITGLARGITIRDAKYPLENAQIKQDYQYGISNEVLPNKKAAVSVSEGQLLLIKVWK